MDEGEGVGERGRADGKVIVVILYWDLLRGECIVGKERFSMASWMEFRDDDLEKCAL